MEQLMVQKTLTSSQKKVSQNIHDNCGHPSKEDFLRGSSSQSCPTRGSRLRATRVRVSSMGSQRASSKTQTPSSAAADLSLPRNTWCGSFLRLSLQTVPESFSATWCVGALCTNCVFLFWTRLLKLWQNALQSGGSTILVLPCGPLPIKEKSL